MPELPEVEAARRAIEEHCIGKKIKKAIVADDSKVIDGVSRADFEAALLGKTLIAALRKGKNLWLQLDSPPFPSFQFGMTGAIYIKGVAVTKYKRSAVKDTEEWPSKYSKLFIELDDGSQMSFTDKRRFAKVRLLKDPASMPPISDLGPDALLEPMTEDEFYESLRKKKNAIKTLLLDQSYISGIGNWVADEVLYHARIHPLQNAHTMSKESCATLNKCIKEVIEQAVEVGAESSQFPKNWIFHFREKKPGKAFLDGKKIDFITAGGRTTAYVPELQKLSGNQTIKAVDKPKRQASKRKKDGDNDDKNENGTDEPENEETEIAKTSKSKREVKPRGRGNKPPAKRKSKSSDDDNDVHASDDDNADGNDVTDEPENEEREVAKTSKSKREVKARGCGKKPPATKKSKSSDDDDEDDNFVHASDDGKEEDVDDQKRQQGRINNSKRTKIGKASNKDATTNQSSKKPTKKAK